MQTVVNDEPVLAYEGMLFDRPERIETGNAAELIYFGKAVSVLKSTAIDAIPRLVRGYTSGEVLAGIAIADPTVERLASPTGVANGAAHGAFLANSQIPMLRKGRIWVHSADAISDTTRSVFIKNADSTGTAATITDTTSYPVADQDGKTSVVTISGYAAQTVTFAGATTTAAGVASQMNAQLKGCSVAVVGGQVKITTDAVGSTVTIAASAGTGALTWDTPVAGTGAVAILAENARGSFRATTASGYTEVTTGLSWLRGATVGGKYYGLLEVNLP